MVQALVTIVMGSASDWPVMQGAADMLQQFQIAYDVTVSSAHRAPQRTAQLARQAAERGVQVIIAGAGGAAHLAGVIAAETTLPVIGVPIDAPPLHGLDALLATVQMPRGVPVATVAVGRSGAANAGILAAQIIALGAPEVAARLRQFKAELAMRVERDAEALQAQLPQHGTRPHGREGEATLSDR
jgi:phosphoribosylaminoimidazole carboxylase PurE protein